MVIPGFVKLFGNKVDLFDGKSLQFITFPRSKKDIFLYKNTTV